MHDKDKFSPVILEVDEDDEAFSHRRNCTVKAWPNEDAPDISDFGAPLSVSLDERL